MGLSLAALVVAFLLLPGAAFMAAARRSGAGVDTTSITARGTLIALAIIASVSLIVHTILIGLVAAIDDLTCVPPINFESLGILLHGAEHDKTISKVFSTVGQNWGWIAFYQVSALLISFGSGVLLESKGLLTVNPGDNWLEIEITKALKRAVEAQAPNGVPPLTKHEIKSLLDGSSKDGSERIGIWIALCVEHPEGTQLVYGEFLNSLTETRSIDDVQAISLENAVRRPLNATPNEWEPIRGEVFLVRFSRIQTINIDLVWYRSEDEVKEQIDPQKSIASGWRQRQLSTSTRFKSRSRRRAD